MITALNSAELAWIAGKILRASRLAHRYTARNETLPSLETLGLTFEAWARSSPSEREEANLLVNALGTAFGQHLANGLGLAWVLVDDENGRDLALHGQPHDILLFPVSSTVKRYESGEYRFFEPLYEMMKADVEKIRREA